MNRVEKMFRCTLIHLQWRSNKEIRKNKCSDTTMSQLLTSSGAQKGRSLRLHWLMMGSLGTSEKYYLEKKKTPLTSHEWRSHPINSRVIGDRMSLSSKQDGIPMATYAQSHDRSQWHDKTLGSMDKKREGIPNVQEANS